MATARPRRDERKTVFLLITTFDMGGAEGIFIQVARGLSERGYRVIAACLQKRSGQVQEALNGSAIELVDLGVTSILNVGKAWRLVRFLRQNHVDVVYTFLIHAHLVGRIAARMANVPVVISSQQTMLFENRLMRWGNRMTARLCSTVIAVSSSVKEYLVRDVGMPRHKITMIYNAIATDRFDHVIPRRGDGSHSFYVGYCARLRPEKDHHRLIQAVQLAKERCPGIRLLLAGDGPERGRLERFVSSEGLKDTVEFLGHVDDVPAFYSRLDLYVQASYIEGLPLAILEALACALPVVASRVGGNEEILEDREAGVLVEPRDHVGLANAIIWMATHRDEARQMGLNGRRVVRERFSAPAMVSNTESLIRKFIDAQQPLAEGTKVP